MRKKQFLQFRRAMATLLAVAMIGQNTVMTTAENYVADNTAVVAEEQAQEPEVQVEESASPAVQESAPAAETPAEPAAQAVAETPAEPAAQAVAEKPAEPAEPAAPAVVETPAEPAVQTVAETPAEPAAQEVVETPAEPAAQEVVETPAEPAGQTVAKTPETPAEQEPSVSAETSSGSASQEPAADADKASAAEAEIDGNTVPAENPSPELGKEVLYRITFNGDAAAHGMIQVKGETAPVDVASYNKEVKENEKFEFSITAAQGYETERVTLEADGTQLVKNAEGFYEIPAVTKAENILVTYKEIPQESAANTGSTEESEEEPEGEPVEEPAEEPIEENTDELEMPVFDYSGSCAGVTAAIYAEEGVLPEGTTVELAPLSDAQIAAAVSVLGCEVSDILGLDITFIYNGEEIQPSGNVAVSFTAAEIADVDVTSVYHVGDDGAVNEVAASQEGSSLGFTTDSFSGYLVNLAGLNGQPSETAITGNTTVAVGETITLTGSRNTNCSYEQKWESTDSSKAVIFKAKGNSAEVTGIEEGKVTITHTYCSKWKKNHWPHQENSESIEVTVTAPVYATELSLPETVSVERGSTVTITPISLKPENATLTWKSDNSAVATVDSKGIVTGKKPGTATISAQSGDRIATTTVTVKAISGGSDNTGKSWSDVEFYYLKTPTSDKNSNSVDQWGSCLGIGSIDLTGATWDANNKNTFDNVPARVITWPSGGTGSTYTVTKNSAAWKEILKYWKTQIQNNLEVEITDDDIESITLTPYKISRNEKYHVDCTIDIKCKRVVTAKYFLWDAGTNVTQYDQVYAKSFVINKGTTQPSDSDKLSLPSTKTVDGKNYTLKAWYSNPSLQGETVTFPYSIGESNVNFYAKYVRSDIKYTVNYYWNGTTEKVADSVTGFGGEPGNVITKTPKMINGYTPVSYEKKQLVISENGTNEINFYYFKNVELTANSETATYDGKEHSVSGYTGVPEGVSFAGITVGATGTNAGEYPAAFAKGTVGMTDGTGKYIVSKAIDGKLEIGKAAVTLKSATLSKKYDGNALVNGDTALEVESGFAEGEGATYNFTGSQTVVGSSANAFSYELNSNTNIDNYAISKQEGTLTVTNREAKYEITVKANSATATYDGKEHEAVGVETYEFTVEGNSYTVSGLSTEDPKQKDAGSYTNNITGTPVVTDKEGNVVTSEFEVKTENGSLEIGKAAVTLKSATLSKKYDGNALVNGDTALEVESGFAEGEGATYNFTGSQTVVGSSANAFSYELNSNTNIDNYAISKQEGTLTVTNREAKYEITVKANSATATYDGKEHEAVGVETYEFTVEGNSYTVSGLSTEDPKQKDAGSYTNNITGTPVVTDKEGNVVTSEFEVKTENGSLEIGKAAVTLKSATLSKKYDGNALVNGDTALEVESGFAEGEGATYNFTGSQTVVGSSANAFSYELNSNTNIDNYAISKQEGTLTVTNREAKYEITVKANSATATYDGKEHEAVGVETYEFTVEGNSYTVSGLSTEDPKQKDAGSYTNNITGTPVVTDKEGNVVTSEFEVKTENGSLTITPRQVNLTSESASKPYDGTPLTRPSVTGGDGFVAGEVTDIRATGSVTNVSEGEVTNAITYATGEKFNADNYNITREEGRLSITASQEKVTVTITGHTNTEKYDGTPKKAEGYEVAIASDSGLYKEADFSFSGTAEVEKTDAAETAYPMGLAAGQFTNTNTNFANVEFVVTDGALTITPRQVILTSATDEKVYDGTPLTNHNVTVSGDGFAAGEGATYDVTGTQTDKGSSDNTFTYKLNEDTKASNYNIEIAVGKLTVKESEKTVVVTIKGNTDGKTYDGTEHSVSGYQVESIKIGENDTNLYTENDFEFSGKAEAKGTNAGTYPMGLKEAQFTNKNENFTSVVFVVTDGKLEISPKQVTLTSESASKPYDGTALTRPDVAGGDGFVAGEVTDIRATGSVTNVSEGEVTNAITYATGEKFNADNYNITREEGRLSITASQEKVTVTITGHTNTEKYDGTPKKAEGYEVAIASDSGLYKEADFSFSGTAEVEKTDAAETAYPMGLAAGQFTNTNTNFANVEFVVTDGALTITPRQVILTSATDEKVYDGTPLTNHNVTVSGDGFAAGEGATYDVTGTQTDKGSSDNTFTYKLNENTKASNYSIELAPGELTVTPVTDKVIVTITEHSASLKYNGAEQSVTGYDTAIDNTLYKETDFTFSGDATAKGTDFGSYPMNLKAEDFTNKNKNFANVVFEIVDGQLEITKRDVELISGSDEKVYDGTPLTKNHILIAGDQFVPGEGADYDVTGSQTNAGSSDNEFTYRLNSSTKAINYNIKTTPGTLKVTPVTDNVIVTITEHSGSAKYDGTEKTVTGYDVAIDNELYTENDFTFSGNDVIKATDADIYNMELKPSDFNNISHNFASVTFKIVDGTLNISRRDVTLTSATDSKTYDGKPLTNDNVAVGGDGFAEGEGAVYNVTGSQTEAGFSNNTFSYELKDNTKPDNYNITSFEGILTVSSSEDEVVVTITGNKGTQKYDGTEKTVEGYTVSITSPLYKESDFTFDGIALAKGTNADTYMMGLSEENFTNTNKNFARVTFHVIDGSLVIEKRNLVLTSASAQKVYNGTELTAKDVTVSGDGFVKGEGASYDVTGTQTTVGDSENTFTYKLNENTNADNYTIETKNGSLLVTPVTDQVVVTLKENSGTEVYDGTEKTVTGYTVADISNKLYTDKDFTFTGNAEVKGTDAGTYDMELKAEDFQNINPNFTNVVFKVEDGALEITRRQVTFQADSGEKKYDGEELTVPTWKLADGTLADGQQEIAHVEGSQTLVGESENKITDLKIFANAASQEAEGSETEAQDVTKNYSIILLAGLLKVTDGSEEDPVDPGQVVTKTHEDKTYDLDETVTFTINVKNIYDEAKTVRIIELPGVVIEGAPQETPNVLTVEKVPAGETVTATATYKITEADIANGSFVNTVKVEFEGGKPFENTDTVITVDPVRSYTLTKKSSASIHENGMFKAGETIHYTLTVTNTGNQTLENVEITDTLNAAGTISNIQGADSKQDGKVTIFTISSLAPKAEATITYDYMVQEADKGNTISNAAVGTPANPEDPDGEKPGDNTDNPVENPKLEVKKDIVSITAADGTQKDKAGKADLNDIITYSVTVTNTGNVKLTNVKITDSLEGIQLAEGQSFDLGILEAGKAKTVTYTYQVKESDLGKSILNTATATGDVPENPADTPKPEGKDEKEVPTEDPANCSITVTKRLTNIQGELLAVRAADFYVTLFSDEAMTQKAADTKMIHFDENQGTSSVTFDQLKRGTYYVAETDAEGKVVAEGTYNNGSYVAQYQAGNKVEITENGTAAQFQFDNQFLLLPDEYYIVKTITINKTVVKKNGEDLKSEETFYAGIFKDEDCTQLADGVSQNIVPLVMDGESTATAKTEVTVPVGGEEIKLYVTEVTADGTPVALNDTFEYDVEINDGFVTLSETSEDATVLIINTSRKEEPEPTAEPAQEPTEAPAEPTQAPQITQQPEDRAVTTNGVKTGDDSPLTQLAFMLFAASAAILLIIFLKKKDEKDIMK